MRLDYAFATVGLTDWAARISARTIRHAITATLSDHYPLEVIVEAPTAGANGDASADAPVAPLGPRSVGCAEAALPCGWMRQRAELRRRLKQRAAAVAAAHQQQWRGEQAAVVDPGRAYPFPWRVVSAASGQSCDDACHEAFAAFAAFAGTQPPSQLRSRAVSTGVCVEAARPVLNACARLTAARGCALGCATTSGPELPAIVTDLDSGAAGQCLLDRDVYRDVERDRAPDSSGPPTPEPAPEPPEPPPEPMQRRGLWSEWSAAGGSE